MIVLGGGDLPLALASMAFWYVMMVGIRALVYPVDSRRASRNLLLLALPAVLFWGYVVGRAVWMSSLTTQPPEASSWLLLILALASAGCGVGALVMRVEVWLRVIVALLGLLPLVLMVVFFWLFVTHDWGHGS
jgi:hypothetical protein